MSAKEAKAWFQQNVSRETFSALEIYERELLKWQARINLVSASTLSDLWLRHFLDSWQLAEFMTLQNVSRETLILDLGSGAGFPGLILWLAGFQNVNLVESDQRKCAFLREVVSQISQNVSRETLATKPTIHNARVEAIKFEADIITCRAFAPFGKILDISRHLRHKDTVYYLLKPQDMAEEIAEATRYWGFDAHSVPSRTDERGALWRISQIRPK